MRPDPMIPEDRHHRLRSALRLVAGLSLLAFLAVAVTPALISGSLGDRELAAPDGEVPSVVVAPAASRSQSPDVALAQVIETFEVFGGKNPFEKPAVFPSGSPSVSAPVTTAPGQTPGDTTPTTAGTNPDGQTGSTTSTTQAVQTDPVRNEAVALIDVFSDDGTVTATVRVGGTVYRVTEGQTFQNSYRVLSLDLSEGCGSFMYGDSRFNLCEGQEILK